MLRLCAWWVAGCGTLGWLCPITRTHLPLLKDAKELGVEREAVLPRAAHLKEPSAHEMRQEAQIPALGEDLQPASRLLAHIGQGFIARKQHRAAGFFSGLAAYLKHTDSAAFNAQHWGEVAPIVQRQKHEQNQKAQP